MTDNERAIEALKSAILILKHRLIVGAEVDTDAGVYVLETIPSETQPVGERHWLFSNKDTGESITIPVQHYKAQITDTTGKPVAQISDFSFLSFDTWKRNVGRQYLKQRGESIQWFIDAIQMFTLSAKEGEHALDLLHAAMQAEKKA